MDRRTIQILLRTSTILLCVITIGGYALYSSKAFVAGPRITITSPLDGTVLSTSTVSIVGVAKNIKDIHVNDRPILIDEKGNFIETTLLYTGYNIFLVRANDRFGRTTSQSIRLFYTRQ